MKQPAWWVVQYQAFLEGKDKAEQVRQKQVAKPVTTPKR